MIHSAWVRPQYGHLFQFKFLIICHKYTVADNEEFFPQSRWGGHKNYFKQNKTVLKNVVHLMARESFILFWDSDSFPSWTRTHSYQKSCLAECLSDTTLILNLLVSVLWEPSSIYLTQEKIGPQLEPVRSGKACLWLS